MQVGAEQGLAVFPDGKEAGHKRRCQGGQYERLSKVAVQLWSDLSRRAVERAVEEQRKGQQKRKNLTAEEQESKRQDTRRRSHPFGGILGQTLPNLGRIVVHAASGKMGQVGNIGAQTVTAKELRQQ